MEFGSEFANNVFFFYLAYELKKFQNTAYFSDILRFGKPHNYQSTTKTTFQIKKGGENKVRIDFEGKMKKNLKK